MGQQDTATSEPSSADYVSQIIQPNADWSMKIKSQDSTAVDRGNKANSTSDFLEGIVSTVKDGYLQVYYSVGDLETTTLSAMFITETEITTEGEFPNQVSLSKLSDETSKNNLAFATEADKIAAAELDSTYLLNETTSRDTMTVHLSETIFVTTTQQNVLSDAPTYKEVTPEGSINAFSDPLSYSVVSVVSTDTPLRSESSSVIFQAVSSSESESSFEVSTSLPPPISEIMKEPAILEQKLGNVSNVNITANDFKDTKLLVTESNFLQNISVLNNSNNLSSSDIFNLDIEVNKTSTVTEDSLLSQNSPRTILSNIMNRILVVGAGKNAKQNKFEIHGPTSDLTVGESNRNGKAPKKYVDPVLTPSVTFSNITSSQRVMINGNSVARFSNSTEENPSKMSLVNEDLSFDIVQASTTEVNAVHKNLESIFYTSNATNRIFEKVPVGDSKSKNMMFPALIFKLMAGVDDSPKISKIPKNPNVTVNMIVLGVGNSSPRNGSLNCTSDAVTIRNYKAEGDGDTLENISSVFNNTPLNTNNMDAQYNQLNESTTPENIVQSSSERYSTESVEMGGAIMGSTQGLLITEQVEVVTSTAENMISEGSKLPPFQAFPIDNTMNMKSPIIFVGLDQTGPTWSSSNHKSLMNHQTLPFKIIIFRTPVNTNLNPLIQPNSGKEESLSVNAFGRCTTQPCDQRKVSEVTLFPIYPLYPVYPIKPLLSSSTCQSNAHHPKCRSIS